MLKKRIKTNLKRSCNINKAALFRVMYVVEIAAKIFQTKKKILKVFNLFYLFNTSRR